MTVYNILLVAYYNREKTCLLIQKPPICEMKKTLIHAMQLLSVKVQIDFLFLLQAEKLLIQDGDFLVRQSSNDPNQFVLSGRESGHSKHLLLIDPEGVVSFIMET